MTFIQKHTTTKIFLFQSPESCENSKASNVSRSEFDTFIQDFEDGGDTEADLGNIVNSEGNNKSVNVSLIGHSWHSPN